MGGYLVTGSSGHLGEALVRVLRERGDAVTGLDVTPSPFTDVVGSVTDPAAVRAALDGAERVLHTATLHKPHVESHPRRAFVDVNVHGTLTVLEQAAAAGVRSVVFTSTTSAFGRALRPAPGSPAAWIDETVPGVVRNIYGATKTAAEDLCALAAADGLPVVVLRTSRFFPEGDDDPAVRDTFSDVNIKAVEFLYRRVDVADVVDAHLLAAERAPELGFGRYVISATTPFGREHLAGLGVDAPAVLVTVAPDLARAYADLGWRMFPTLDRVYVNARARDDLGWEPRWDARRVATAVMAGDPAHSALATAVGAKGYHSAPTGIYTR